MTTLALDGVSPLLVCAATIVVSVLAGLMPCSPFEPMLIGIAVVAPRHLLLPLAALATVTQMGTKTLVYLTSRKAESTLSPRKRAAFERIRRYLVGRRWLQIAAVLVSGIFGLPPFYIVTVACGALRLPLREYLVAGTTGRAIRFTAIMLVPRLFVAVVVLLAGASPLLAQEPRPASAVNGSGAETYVLVAGLAAGVALRLAALAPKRVSALYLLDAGAIAGTRTPVLSSSLRLVPLIARIPHGREFIRRRYLRGLRENSGRQEWLDAKTEHAYTQPMLDDIGRVVAFALRLGRADQADSLAGVIGRIRAPITVILGDAPHPSAPGTEELEALAPLGVQLRIEHLAGVGHFPHEEAPDDVARIIIAPRLAVANAADSRR